MTYLDNDNESRQNQQNDSMSLDMTLDQFSNFLVATLHHSYTSHHHRHHIGVCIPFPYFFAKLQLKTREFFGPKLCIYGWPPKEMFSSKLALCCHTVCFHIAKVY